MKTLSIDTSGRTLSAALHDEDRLLGEITLASGRHHSETLLPAVEALTALTRVPLREVDLFACTVGPGSFTGLRIGAATVKGLAMAMGKPVRGVSTLAALALGAAATEGLLVCPLLDARRGQVYWGLYMNEGGRPKNLVPDGVSDIEALAGRIEEKTLFVGEGLETYGTIIRRILGDLARIEEGPPRTVRAAQVGLLAYRDYLEEGAEDPLTFAPRYRRLSEAEEKKAARTLTRPRA